MKKGHFVSSTMVMVLLIVAVAQRTEARSLSYEETSIAMDALMKAAGSNLSDDPSCKSDLSQPGAMLVGQGVARLLTRAATTKGKILVRVGCFERDGWPKEKGQEYCKIGISDSERTGLVFLMDWPKHIVVPGTVECSN
jgi:hypothetical protein